MDLEAYASQLSDMLDESMNLVREYNSDPHRYAAAAYRLSLDMLHIYTDGQYGTLITDLPSPWDIVPVLPA